MRGRMPGWIPRADRSDVMVKAALHFSGRDIPVTIIDMSERGCKVRCLHVLPIGEVSVQLSIPAFQPNSASVRLVSAWTGWLTVHLRGAHQTWRPCEGSVPETSALGLREEAARSSQSTVSCPLPQYELQHRGASFDRQ